MKPPPFRYIAARSVEEALGALHEAGGEAKLLAGGQSLMPMLNFRLLRPAVLVDINRIPGLSGATEDADCVRIGALTRHTDLQNAPAIRARFPIVADALSHVAHLAVRNRGTAGGSLSHADPAAELPMLACLLDARIRTQRAAAANTRDAAAFFLGPLATAMEPDEMLVGIDLPLLPERHGWGFAEHARRHGDFALAAVAVILSAENGSMRNVRVAAMGVGDTPLRLPSAERVLEGAPFAPESLAAAADAVRGSLAPMSDLHASADYRRHLAGVLAVRALRAAWERAAA